MQNKHDTDIFIMYIYNILVYAIFCYLLPVIGMLLCKCPDKKITINFSLCYNIVKFFNFLLSLISLLLLIFELIKSCSLFECFLLPFCLPAVILKAPFLRRIPYWHAPRFPGSRRCFPSRSYHCQTVIHLSMYCMVRNYHVQSSYRFFLDKRNTYTVS